MLVKEEDVVERNNHEYYIARAKTARTLSERADDPKIAQIHAAMADHYDRFLQEIDQGEELPRLQIVAG